MVVDKIVVDINRVVVMDKLRVTTMTIHGEDSLVGMVLRLIEVVIRV